MSKKVGEASKSIKLKRFGKYLILDHLVDGGMAKICRARYLGEQANKIVAIKMIQSKYSNDESFRTMFMDEVKVSFGLQHPNIVQTFDYGYCEERFYVAMEYCDGQNLKNYIAKLSKSGHLFPIDISVYIISQVCQGLFYAHTLTDKLTGKDLNIVHRDISPHNIMVTYDGSVKIIDFGIAKASSNAEVTQAGMIKGKLSYLAPEYLEGKNLDHRYDQFSLGIVLWEMLCSQKLFKGDNDLAALKSIQQCKIPPPSSINKNVPKELDEIILKTLSKDREKRFKDLNEMNKVLTKFLYTYKSDFSPIDIGSFAKTLFKDQILKDRESFFAYGKIDIKPFLNEITEGATKKEPTRGANNNHTIFDLNDDILTARNEKKHNRARMRAKGILQKNKKTDQLEIEKPIYKEGTATHKISAIPTGSFIRRKQIFKKTALLACLIVGFFTLKNELPDSLVSPIESTLEKGNKVYDRSTASIGYVTLNNIDKSRQQVFINGKKEKINALKQVAVPLSQEFTLRVQTSSKEHFVTALTVQPNETETHISIAPTKSAVYGYLFATNDCLSGSLEFSLFGESRSEQLPLKGRSIAFPLTIKPNGQTAPSSHELIITQKHGIQKKKVLTIDHKEQFIDICKL